VGLKEAVIEERGTPFRKKDRTYMKGLRLVRTLKSKMVYESNKVERHEITRRKMESANLSDLTEKYTHPRRKNPHLIQTQQPVLTSEDAH